MNLAVIDINLWRSSDNSVYSSIKCLVSPVPSSLSKLSLSFLLVYCPFILRLISAPSDKHL